MLQVIAYYSTKNTTIEYAEAVKEFISIASDIAGAEEPIIKITKKDHYGIHYELLDGLANLGNAKFSNKYIKSIKSARDVKDYFDIVHTGDWPAIWTDTKEIVCETGGYKSIIIGINGIRIDYKKSSYVPKTYIYMKLIGDILPEDDIHRDNALCNNDKFFKAFNYDFDEFKKICLKHDMIYNHVLIDEDKVM